MMITNLVSTITQSLSPDAIGKIASFLGVDETAAERGIGAGIPGILAGLANAASTPGGAQRLGSVVSQIQDMPAEDIVKHLLGGDHRKLAESGWPMLSSLAGGGFFQTLSTAIARFSGLGQVGARDLLGLLVPLVLGFLRREQIAKGLDSKGMASLLATQRDNIRRAMPAEMALRLQDSDIRPASQPPSPESFRRPAALAPRRASGNWAFWLLPLLILAGVAIYVLPIGEERRTAQDANSSTTTAAKTAPANPATPRQQEQASTVPAPAGPAAATVEDGIMANIGRLRASLQTIKDPATAQAALGEIENISAEFGRLKAMAQQLPPEARKALAATVARRVPDLNGLIDRIGSSQMELGGESKPAMDSLKSQLAGIAKA